MSANSLLAFNLISHLLSLQGTYDLFIQVHIRIIQRLEDIFEVSEYFYLFKPISLRFQVRGT